MSSAELTEKGKYLFAADRPLLAVSGGSEEHCTQSKRNAADHNSLKLLALVKDLKTVDCNRSMSSNPIASAIFCPDKALIIQGFVVSGIQEICSSLFGSFPHLFGHFRNPTLLTPLSAQQN